LFTVNRFPHPLQSNAIFRPEHAALQLGDAQLTFLELRDQVALRAAGLREQGLQPGQRVALAAQSTLSFVIDLLAIGWCDASAALIAKSCAKAAVAQRLESAPCDAQIGAEFAGCQLRSLLPSRPNKPLPAPSWTLESERFLLWTSGSTGRAKPVSISSAQWIFSAMGSALRLEHRLDDVWLGCLPFEHIGGLSVLLRTTLYGTTTRIHAGFDAFNIAREMASGRITQVSLVPSMLRRVLQVDEPNLAHPHLRVVLLGGAQTDAELSVEARRAGLPLYRTWGMTESASQICTLRDSAGIAPNNMGAPLSFMEVSEVDAKLSISGLMTSTQTQLTGDLGSIDAKGHISVTGRFDRVIKSGGKKISLSRLESVLLSLPAVHDALVLGRLDKAWGERPVAFVKSSASALELQQQLAPLLEPFEIPRCWFLVDQMPRSELQKIDVSILQQALESLAPGVDEFSLALCFDGAQLQPRLDNPLA
jgi:O-succinylbenzoic acid--CoA ligase